MQTNDAGNRMNRSQSLGASATVGLDDLRTLAQLITVT